MGSSSTIRTFLMDRLLHVPARTQTTDFCPPYFPDSLSFILPLFEMLPDLTDEVVRIARVSVQLFFFESKSGVGATILILQKDKVQILRHLLFVFGIFIRTPLDLNME